MATVNKDFVSRYGVQGTVLRSTVSTGTSPLVVQSTTLVNNLNADLLDGLEASAFISNPMTTLGDLLYGGASGAPTRLAGNITTNPQFLTSTGSGSNATAPTLTGSTGSGNVALATSPTLTTPTIDGILASGAAATPALWATVTTGSITIGSGLTTGTLNLAAAGTGATTVNVGHTNADINLTGATIDVTGTLSATSPAISTSITTPSATFTFLGTTATNVSLATAATTLSIGAGSGTTTVNNNMVVTGDLTVNGTTTTMNSTTITVDDKNIELGSVAVPTDTTADGGGITLKGTTDKTIIWDNANDNWSFNQNVNVSTGFSYKINNVTLLTATGLGSTVVSSSLTSVGTVTSGTWSGSFGAVSGANLTNLTAGNLSGTIPSGVLGNSTVYIGTTAVALNRASASLALTGITSIDGNAATATSAATLSGTNAVQTDKTVTVVANATPTTLDSFSVATYRSALYLVQMIQGTKMTTTSLLIAWDGADVLLTEYGVVDAALGAANAALTATHSAGTMTVSATSSDATTTNVVIKASVQYIKA